MKETKIQIWFLITRNIYFLLVFVLYNEDEGWDGDDEDSKFSNLGTACLVCISNSVKLESIQSQINFIHLFCFGIHAQLISFIKFSTQLNQTQL